MSNVPVLNFDPSKCFYVNVTRQRNAFHVTGYDISTGARFTECVRFEPTMYLAVEESKSNTEMVGLRGERLCEFNFENAYEAGQWARGQQEQEYEGQPPKVYGQNRWPLQLISALWPPGVPVPYDQKLIKFCTIDIETTTRYGFPDTADPKEEVVLVTMSIRHKGSEGYVTFGVKPWDKSAPESAPPAGDEMPARHTYVLCRDEKDLLEKVIKFWRSSNIDVVTGHNIEAFDLPYLANRIDRVLGEGAMNQLSPFGEVQVKEKFVMKEMRPVVSIAGVHVLDNMLLYQKFELAPRASYSLDSLSEVELGKHKAHAGFDNYQEWFEKGWNSYVTYNVVDVMRVNQIEAKKKFLDIACQMTYDARAMLTAALSPVQLWDALLCNSALGDGKIIHAHRGGDGDGESKETYEGAYVIPTKTGKYGWVMSFDVASSYPHQIALYGISPENIVEIDPADHAQIVESCLRSVSADRREDLLTAFLATMENKTEDMLNPTTKIKEACLAAVSERSFDNSELVRLGYSMSPGGTLFLKRSGFLGNNAMRLYAERKKTNKKIKDLGAEAKAIDAELKTRSN